MKKKFQKVFQVSLEILFFISQKIKKHHEKNFSKSCPGEVRNFIFHNSKYLKTS
jgi:hypothetical protein